MSYFSLSLTYAICPARICLKCWEPSACSAPRCMPARTFSPFLPCKVGTTLLCCSLHFATAEMLLRLLGHPLIAIYSVFKHLCDSSPASPMEEVPINICKTCSLCSPFFDKIGKRNLLNLENEL